MILQGLFYSLVFALLLSRAVTSGVSHDENQFIAAGQLLADHGLLPYRDYPYTHMPYGVFLYALTARISPYDYLAGRILGAIIWLACIVLIIMLTRLIGRDHGLPARSRQSALLLFGEFALVFIFLYHPISTYVLGAALNHSFATALSLTSLLFFVRTVEGISSWRRGAFMSGIFISLAAFTRFNFASLIIIFLFIWALYSFAVQPQLRFKVVLAFIAGVAIAASPAFVLLLLDPAGFYYANLVFIRLNTLYYEGILFRQNMDLAAKASSFLNSLLHSPIDFVLYSMLFLYGIICIVRFIRSRSPLALYGLTAAAFAGTLFITAFSPTPTQWHYFFAPLPFMLLLVALVAWELYQRSRVAYVLLFCGLLVALLSTIRLPNPTRQISRLLHPTDWIPLQVHAFGESLRGYVAGGEILTLMPMISLEAGFNAYAFTATGPFTWRTSLLLAPTRRADYGVISPEELPQILASSPPDGILTGFETSQCWLHIPRSWRAGNSPG